RSQAREVLDRLNAQIKARLPEAAKSYGDYGETLPERVDLGQLGDLAGVVRDYLSAERDFALAFPPQPAPPVEE
ncbi:hypothetical protein NL483_27920, partial [Klebsiella pneumoniae]|nr:hypothetical protein [Klebsiella pneumoniae]